MSINALQAAKYLIKRSKWTLFNIQVQKLLYIANMVWLGDKDEPLLDERFEAWDYGPVIPSVYHKLKCFGSRPVGNVLRRVPDLKDDKICSFLDDMLSHLGNKTGGELVAITHWEQGAWAMHYSPGVLRIPIPTASIKREYNLRFSQ